jgi:hypothetical protein
LEQVNEYIIEVQQNKDEYVVAQKITHPSSHSSYSPIQFLSFMAWFQERVLLLQAQVRFPDAWAKERPL